MSVGVVLSGTGSDGANGLRSIRSAGGLTLVQSPGVGALRRHASGRHRPGQCRPRGRRRRARASSWPASLPGPGRSRTRPPPRRRRRPFRRSRPSSRRSIGIDFSGYKESTMRRQVQRRMALRQIGDIDAYLAAWTDDADEAHALSKQPPGHRHLLLPRPRRLRRAARRSCDVPRSPGHRGGPARLGARLRHRRGGLLDRHAGQRDPRPPDRPRPSPQDLRDRPRRGEPRGRAPRGLSALRSRAHPEVAARSHTPQETGRRASRSPTPFASAPSSPGTTSAADPPFPRIDLVSCRNTLIYFTAPLQERVIGMFGFALRAGGLLFLGSAENLDRTPSGFRVIDADQRIFLRTGEAARSYTHSLVRPVGASGSDRAARRSLRAPSGDPGQRTASSRSACSRRSCARAAKSFLALDDEHRLIEVVGDVSPYCRVAEGRMTGAVVVLPATRAPGGGTGPPPALPGRSRARRGPVHPPPPIVEPAVHLVATTGRRSATRRSRSWCSSPTTLVPSHAIAGHGRTEFDRELRRLEHELLVSQDTLRRSLVELQAVNEELEASSEELQAASEELQASNEELQASNEELQATNEELGTLNQELTVRGDDLQVLNTDLENIQSVAQPGHGHREQGPAGHAVHARGRPRLRPARAPTSGSPCSSAPTTVEIPGFETALRERRRGRAAREHRGGQRPHLLPRPDPAVPGAGRPSARRDRHPDGRVRDGRPAHHRARRPSSSCKDKSELLEHEATFDSVTGLVNRGHFSQLLANSIARAQRNGTQLALAWIDLDNFKEINDEFGHETGDITLQVTSQRVDCSASAASDAVGRLGGDEIGVLHHGVRHDGRARRRAGAHRRVDPGAHPDRRSGSAADGERRGGPLPRGRPVPQRPDARGRRGDVRGQAAFRRRVRLLRPVDERCGGGPAGPTRRDRGGHREQRVPHALPARRRCDHRRGVGRRGTRALAAGRGPPVG